MQLTAHGNFSLVLSESTNNTNSYHEMADGATADLQDHAEQQHSQLSEAR